MSNPECDRLGWDELMDYAAGDLPDAEAAALEEHLFACESCRTQAAGLDALLHAIPAAVRSAEVGGFVTDTVLNRLSREGIRVRTFSLASGEAVPCAVWEGDELMALRLRGDFSGVGEVTLSQQVAGREIGRASAEIAGNPGELIFISPAAWVRQLPVIEVEILLTADHAGQERRIGTYTLLHGGGLQR